MNYPPMSFDFRHPARTSPRQPQNLPRPTAKGCGPCAAAAKAEGFGRMGMGGLLGLKAVGDAAERGEIPQGVWITYSLLSSVTAVAGAYHGYKRNNSAGWAFVWFILSGSFFMFAAPLMFAQGFAKPAKKG